MPTIYEGDLLAQDLRVGVVVSRFNDFLTSRLLDGAMDAFVRHGGAADGVTVAYVPGSVELPLVASRLAGSGRVQAVVCLGCVIRGATDHYDHVVQQAAKGISEVSLQTGVPVVFGVITADTLDHAIERAGTKQGNYGAKAMLSAIEMANLLKKLPAAE
jgi:6,7-dimethyl-8-ribityllumazine synthase